MRISDWSSDVCSSDLNSLALGRYIANERKRDKSCIANQIAVRKGIKAIGRNSYLITSIQPILSCLSARQQRQISATCATGQKTSRREHHHLASPHQFFTSGPPETCFSNFILIL